MSNGQREFTAGNLKKAIIWYVKVLDFDHGTETFRGNVFYPNYDYVVSNYLIRLTFNQIACAASGGWYWINNAKLFLAKVDNKDPQFKNSTDLLKALKQDY